MEPDELCEKIAKIDRKIRFSGLINNRGRLVAGGMVTKVKSLEDEKKDEMLYMELALRVKMRQEFDADFGQVHFSLSYREKLIDIILNPSPRFGRFCSRDTIRDISIIRNSKIIIFNNYEIQRFLYNRNMNLGDKNERNVLFFR